MVIKCENKGREDKAVYKPRQKCNDEIKNTEGEGENATHNNEMCWGELSL